MKLVRQDWRLDYEGVRWKLCSIIRDANYVSVHNTSTYLHYAVLTVAVGIFSGTVLTGVAYKRLATRIV